MLTFLRRNLLAFIIIAGLAVGLVTALQNQHSQAKRDHHALVVVRAAAIKQCVYTNSLVHQFNQRVPPSVKTTHILYKFLTNAARARYAVFRTTHVGADITAARTFTRLAKELDDRVHFNLVRTVNCARAFPAVD